MPEIIAPAESEDGFAHLKQSPDAAHIRFYLWLYEANPDNINTCKLFWAYVFFLPALVLHGVIALARFIDRKLPDPPKVDWEREALKRAEKAERGPSTMERILTAVGDKLGWVWSKLSTPLEWLFKGALVLLGIFAVVALVISFIQEPWGSLVALLVIFAGIAVFCGLIWLVENTSGGALGRFWRFFKKLASGFHRHTCAKIDLS